MTLEARIAQSETALAEYLNNPSLIEELEIEQMLDILAGIQLHFELIQAYTRAHHSEHSSEFMAAHADANYWKNKLMNAKVKARLLIANKERGM
jgi:hypothetical protein